MTANFENLLDKSLEEIWNERDDRRRMDAIKRIYHPDILFYEKNTEAPISGFDAINTRIIELFQHWPAGFAFQFKTGSEINHNIIKKSWTLGLTEAPPFITGMDIALVENGLIKALYLFLNNPVEDNRK
ncbi:MAG: hypothetical protein ABIU63_08545 [Chitinophagaceae bacterium]